MSVPAKKRAVSSYEFYNTAVRLRVHVTLWLLRDFGAKPKVRDCTLKAKQVGMSDEDKKALETILEKYNLGDSVTDTYPQWWINEKRKRIDGILSEMIDCIVRAFSIYATTLAEFDYRRELQTRAITCVYVLLEECQFVISVLYKTGGVDVDRYGHLVEFCTSEIALLKGWRKQGNKQRAGIARKEASLQKRIEVSVA